jgi:hypothetical protein
VPPGGGGTGRDPLRCGYRQFRALQTQAAEGRPIQVQGLGYVLTGLDVLDDSSAAGLPRRQHALVRNTRDRNDGVLDITPPNGRLPGGAHDESSAATSSSRYLSAALRLAQRLVDHPASSG